MWTEVIDQSDIDQLLGNYGYFHDSCLRDIYLSTQEYVDEQLAMHFENKLTASLLFQRQFKPDTVIELKFEGIEKFFFDPIRLQGDAIFEATIEMKNELFYWAEDSGSVVISGKKLFWRQRPELIGNKKRHNDE